jgi:HK97 family phage prohead protease
MQDDIYKYDTFVIPNNGEDTEDETNPITVQETDGKKQLVGYAVVFGAASDVRRDGFKHRFQKGSITWTSPVNALWNHDYGTPLASTSNTTLQLIEDDFGIKVILDLDSTTDGSNTFTRVQNRLVSGMSFGGRRISYNKDPNDPTTIDVTGFVADEVSIVLSPGMTETNIVTSSNTNALEANKQQVIKQHQMKSQLIALDKSKLIMLSVGRVSTGKQVIVDRK